MESLNSNGEWKVKQAYFQGWVKSEVEHFKAELYESKQEILEIKRILKSQNEFDKKLALKVGSVGGGSGLVGGAIVIILKTWLGI